jgi:hypothetical protein
VALDTSKLRNFPGGYDHFLSKSQIAQSNIIKGYPTRTTTYLWATSNPQCSEIIYNVPLKWVKNCVLGGEGHASQSDQN